MLGLDYLVTHMRLSERIQSTQATEGHSLIALRPAPFFSGGDHPQLLFDLGCDSGSNDPADHKIWTTFYTSQAANLIEVGKQARSTHNFA